MTLGAILDYLKFISLRKFIPKKSKYVLIYNQHTLEVYQFNLLISNNITLSKYQIHIDTLIKYRKQKKEDIAALLHCYLLLIFLPWNCGSKFIIF